MRIDLINMQSVLIDLINMQISSVFQTAWRPVTSHVNKHGGGDLNLSVMSYIRQAV
jgi:hypothetical protein